MTDDFTKFELERFNEWLRDVNRKPAHLAFTAGPLRQVATLVERVILEEVSRIRAEVKRLQTVKPKTVSEALEECRSWEISDEELKRLME